MGVAIPDQRKIVKQFAQVTTLSDISELSQSPIHEHRMTALLLLVSLYQSCVKKNSDTSSVVAFYVAHLDYVNNWDLVDGSAPYILGHSVLDRPKDSLFQLSVPYDEHLPLQSMWRQRVAIVATLTLIRNGHFETTIRLAERYLTHRHDLIHKATGWMLRVVGDKDKETLLRFLDHHAHVMPRTMLRYAIEKMPPEQRAYYLASSTRQSGK
jgi:3-methyladenine DNA glycosylase AlkD